MKAMKTLGRKEMKTNKTWGNNDDDMYFELGNSRNVSKGVFSCEDRECCDYEGLLDNTRRALQGYISEMLDHDYVSKKQAGLWHKRFYEYGCSQLCRVELYLKKEGSKIAGLSYTTIGNKKERAIIERAFEECREFISHKVLAYNHTKNN